LYYNIQNTRFSETIKATLSMAEAVVQCTKLPTSEKFERGGW